MALTLDPQAVSIIVRLEGGVVPICSLVAANASSSSYQRLGCACIAGSVSRTPLPFAFRHFSLAASSFRGFRRLTPCLARPFNTSCRFDHILTRSRADFVTCAHPAMCSSPQTAAAAVKAGGLGPAIQILLDKQSAANSTPAGVDAAVQVMIAQHSLRFVSVPDRGVDRTRHYMRRWMTHVFLVARHS